jgi:transposase-like protein
LLNRKMFSYLFMDADIKTERIAGFVKSFIAIKP